MPHDRETLKCLLKPIERGELIEVVSQIRQRMHRWQQALQGTFRALAKT